MTPASTPAPPHAWPRPCARWPASRAWPRAAAWPVFAWQVSVFWHYLRPLAAAAQRELDPDVLLVEHDYALPWAADLAGQVPAVVTFENLSWRYYETRAASAPLALRAPLALEARRFARFDRRHLGATRWRSRCPTRTRSRSRRWARAGWRPSPTAWTRAS